MVDGKLLERVTRKTEPLKLVLSSNHHETIELYVISSPLNPVILGIPWLKKHNPQVNWATSTVRDWSPFCHAHCLRSAIPTRATSSAWAEEEIDLTSVLQEYHDLRGVFRKASASILPPHDRMIAQ